MLEIGQTVSRVPAFSVSDSPGKGSRKQYSGVVVYVHPNRRYHIVEFHLPGGAVREAFLREDDWA